MKCYTFLLFYQISYKISNNFGDIFKFNSKQRYVRHRKSCYVLLNRMFFCILFLIANSTQHSDRYRLKHSSSSTAQHYRVLHRVVTRSVEFVA